MTETTTIDVVFTDPKPGRHKWPKAGEDGFKHTLSIDSVDGNERFEKVCKVCGMTRITLIPPRGFAWHKWKKKGVDFEFEMESTPPCSGSKS